MLTAQDLQYQISYCSSSDIYGLNDQALANISEFELTHGLQQIYSTMDWFKVKLSGWKVLI